MSERFSELYERHVADVYGYLAYRLASRTEAERLTETTFERAFREWGTPASAEPHTRVWLLTIARDATRAYQRPDPGEGDNLGISPDLGRALARLDRGERSVIALYFGARLEGSEIASVLDLSAASVGRLLSQGIRRLRTELERSAAEGGADRGDEEQEEA